MAILFMYFTHSSLEPGFNDRMPPPSSSFLRSSEKLTPASKIRIWGWGLILDTVCTPVGDYLPFLASP